MLVYDIISLEKWADLHAVRVEALLGGLGSLPLPLAAGAEGSNGLASVSGTVRGFAVCMVASLGRICTTNACCHTAADNSFTFQQHLQESKTRSGPCICWSNNYSD